MFVADEIPRELRRMVEFLNNQMTHTEVLAVEVRQYTGTSGVSAFVPFVKNPTAKARELKQASRKRQRWTEADFAEHLKRISEPAVQEAAEKLYRELKEKATSVNYGTGSAPSFNPRLVGVGPGSPITLKANGELSINYGSIGGRFGDLSEGDAGVEQRNLLARKFGPLVGEVPDDERVARYPWYDGTRWAPHAEALLDALEDLAPQPTTDV